MHFAFYNLNLTNQCHAMGKSQYITSAFISGLDTPDDFHCCHIKDILHEYHPVLINFISHILIEVYIINKVTMR
jgi:hypothetical protein